MAGAALPRSVVPWGPSSSRPSAARTVAVTLVVAAAWAVALGPRRPAAETPADAPPRLEEHIGAAPSPQAHPIAGPAAHRPAARRPAWRRLAGYAGTLLTLTVLAFWFVALRPLSLGGTANYTVIHGNSMWPLYKEGDLIVTHQQPDYRVGDVVAYHVPQGEVGAGHLVIHRIIGGSTATGLELQGDNNPSADPWHPKLADVAGASWVQVPRVGRLLSLLHQPLALAVVATLLVVAMLLMHKPRRAAAQAAGTPTGDV